MLTLNYVNSAWGRLGIGDFCSRTYDLNVEKNAIYKIIPVGYEIL